MEGEPAAPRGLRRTFQSLATSRSYRLFFVGQVVSVTGTWMQRVAQDWLILELGGGPFGLAVGVALQSVPFMLFGLWGGLLGDRYNARRLLIGSQATLALLAVAVGVLTIAGWASLPIIYAAAFAVGCVGVVDNPVRQMFVLEMVRPEQTANAISLNSSIFNSARLVGPALGGILIGLVGTGPAYLVNAVTFVAIIVALILIRPDSLHPRDPLPRGRGQVMAGMRYIRTEGQIRRPLVATLVVSLLAQNFRVTLPAFAVEEFDGGSSSYGLLMSAMGVGALAGALVCAHLARPSERMTAVQILLLGGLLGAAAAAPSFVALLVIMAFVGAASTSFNTTSTALLLLAAATPMRARVLSARTLLSNGSGPIGSLGIGWVVAVSGARAGTALGAVATLVTALWSVSRSRAAAPVPPQEEGLARGQNDPQAASDGGHAG